MDADALACLMFSMQDRHALVSRWTRFQLPVSIECQRIIHTLQCRYNVVNFLTNLRNEHPIAHLWGWDMGCLLWVQTLIYVLCQSVQHCIKYHILDVWYNGIGLFIFLWNNSVCKELIHLFIHSVFVVFNPFKPSNAIWHPISGPSLVQVMVCHLFQTNDDLLWIGPFQTEI